MNLTAVITAIHGHIDAASTLTVADDTRVLATGPVPDRTDGAGRLAPARIVAALADLGYRPSGGDYYQSLTQYADRVELQVEPLP